MRGNGVQVVPGGRTWRGQGQREPSMHSTINRGLIPYQGLIVTGLGHTSKATTLSSSYTSQSALNSAPRMNKLKKSRELLSNINLGSNLLSARVKHPCLLQKKRSLDKYFLTSARVAS